MGVLAAITANLEKHLLHCGLLEPLTCLELLLLIILCEFLVKCTL
jgi:hypothetical protein